MRDVIVLDSGPLGLILQRSGYAQADACREWLKRHIAGGRRVLIPEIIDCEVRRELLRLKKTAAVAKLDALSSMPGASVPLRTAALRLAATLWSEARLRGRPMADPHALDIDVILAAQVITAGLSAESFVVATTNVAHLSQLVPSDLWSNV